MKKEKNISINKRQAIVALILILVLLAAMISGTVILAKNAKAKATGELTPNKLDEIKIVYSLETQKLIKNYLNGFLDNLLRGITQNNEGISLNVDMFNINAILQAMINSGISADKAVKFAEYFYLIEFTEDAPLKFLVEALTMPLLDSEGKPVLNEEGKVIRVFNPDSNIFQALTEEVDFPYHFNQIVDYSGFTVSELGAFLYNYDISVSGKERKELLLSLGKENYTVIFVQTAQTFKQISNIASNGNISPGEGRMARDMIFTLGDSYKNILSLFGGDNIEKLLGVGEDIIDLSLHKNSTEEEREYVKRINNASKALKGTASFILSFMGEAMTNISLAATDSLVDYINTKNENSRNFFLLEFVRLINSSLQKAEKEAGLSTLSFIDKLSAASANINMIETENGATFENLKDKASESLSQLFYFVKDIAEKESYKNIVTKDDIHLLNEKEVATLFESFEIISEDVKELSLGFEKAKALITYSFILSMLSSIE